MAMTFATVSKYINRLFPGHIQKRDIEYGPANNARLDIYGIPSDRQKPVVLFWHGGSWKNGDKSYYQFLAHAIERLDAIPVIVGYPLYPDRRYPGFIDDAQQALAWTRKNIAHYGGDADRIFVMGHSAGAHTATMLTAQDRAGEIRGCISVAGPVKLKRQYWENVFGKETFDKGLENPVNHLNDTNHRYLLIHGKADTVVPLSDTVYFERELLGHSNKVTVVSPKRLGHMRILLTLVGPLVHLYTVKKQVKAFISA